MDLDEIYMEHFDPAFGALRHVNNGSLLGDHSPDSSWP